MIRHRFSITKLIGEILFADCGCAETRKMRLSCLLARPC